MKNTLKGIVLLVLLGLAHIGQAQETYEIPKTNGVDIKLMGTSSLHDWVMNADAASGEGLFIFKSGSASALTSVKALSFVLNVKDLKSDNKGLDKNAYAALKADKYQDISYKLTSGALSAEKEGYLLKSKGKLTIAGVTKEVTIDVHCVVQANGTITCKGVYKLNMTDYNIEPPSFMWGAMTTGDALTLDFTVVYTK